MIVCESCHSATEDDAVDMTEQLSGNRKRAVHFDPAIGSDPSSSSSSSSSGQSAQKSKAAVDLTQPPPFQWKAIVCRRCGFLNVTGDLRSMLSPDLPELGWSDPKGNSPSVVLPQKRRRPNHDGDAASESETTADSRWPMLVPRTAFVASALGGFSDCHLRMLKALYSQQPPSGDGGDFPAGVFAAAEEFLRKKAVVLRTRREHSAALAACRVARYLPSIPADGNASVVVGAVLRNRLGKLAASLEEIVDPFVGLLSAVTGELKLLYPELRAVCCASPASALGPERMSPGTAFANVQPMPKDLSTLPPLSAAAAAAAHSTPTEVVLADDKAATLRSKIFLWRLLYGTVADCIVL